MINTHALLLVTALLAVAHAQKDREPPTPKPKKQSVNIADVYSSPLYLRYKNDQVRIPPSVTDDGTKTHIIYKNDARVDLPCEATGSPEPRYEWTKDGEVLELNARNIKPGSKGSISLDPVTSLDEGYYQCRAINIYGTSLSKVFFLQRAVLGRYPPGTVQNYPVKEGSPLKIPCVELKSTPKASHSWELVDTITDKNPDGLRMSRRIIMDDDGHLFFTYVTKADEQSVARELGDNRLYKCNVFNAHLDITTGGSYSRIIVEDGDMRDKPPSLLHTTQSPHVVVQGEEIRIQCIFGGKPEVEVMWDPVPLSRATVDDTGTVLIINNADFDDEKTYTCRGKNSAGVIEGQVRVNIETKPKFAGKPMNMNATDKDTVSFMCDTEASTTPPADIEWLINGVAVNVDNPGERTEISGDGRTLTIRDLCKDCDSGSTDLKVVQCNASNVHGYAFADGYLNVLLPTTIFVPPEDVTLDPDMDEARFDCEASSDASTPVIVKWLRDDRPLDYYADPRMVVNGTSLLIDLRDLNFGQRKKYQGVYKCVATNHYSSKEHSATLLFEGAIIPGGVTSAGFQHWWIFLIIAILLLLLILLLCCCLCCQRNRGDTYPVDEKEREQGNDPEKELADSGFHDYHRPEDGPVKGSRASLTSTIKLDSDDEGSLAEYGDIDTGKFNEDGSFIGQYMTDKKKKPIHSNV